MDLVIKGRCLCGAVQFALSQPPLATRACWCRDCQYLCSGNASLSVFFLSEALTVSGRLAEYVSPSDAGSLIRRRFCPACGTPLFSDALAEPDFLVVRLGVLDDREMGKPQSIIWTASAPSWADIDATVPSCPRQPDWTDKSLSASCL